VVPPYALEVTPGEVFAARGRSITVSARLVPDHEGVTLPTTCTLYRVDSNGAETPLRMVADQSDAFSATFKVEGDFGYHVQAGLALSELFSVTAVTPVALAPESPAITITPPAYAQATLDTQTLHGLVDLTALKHSAIRFEFQFSRPAVSATLFWTPA